MGFIEFQSTEVKRIRSYDIVLTQTVGLNQSNF